MKYNKWIGVGACLLLIGVCFIPWTFHADVGKNFTGFFSEKNAYGKPGKFIVFFSMLCLVLTLLQKVWAQRVQLFVAGVLVAYAIKTFILYSSCYNAYCPEKKLGIYLMIALSIMIFIISLFPDIKLNDSNKKTV